MCKKYILLYDRVQENASAFSQKKYFVSFHHRRQTLTLLPTAFYDFLSYGEGRGGGGLSAEKLE